MRPRTKRLVLAAVVAVVLAPFILGYAWWRHHYPYGLSIASDEKLYLALNDYAIRHGGPFPAGEATPEASLSLLYRSRSADPNLLRGKTIPEAVVKETLERGELLTPDTCGWHYVEGLHMDDNPRIALFWDKVGLDHNGGLLADGGHMVVFLDFETKHIPSAAWDAFIAEQGELLAENSAARHANFQIDGRLVRVRVGVKGDHISGSANWNSEGSSGSLGSSFATVKKQNKRLQGLPVIPAEEIKNAKVVVEQDKERVRFILKSYEIIYDKSGFRVEDTKSEPLKAEAGK